VSAKLTDEVFSYIFTYFSKLKIYVTIGIPYYSDSMFLQVFIAFDVFKLTLFFIML